MNNTKFILLVVVLVIAVASIFYLKSKPSSITTQSSQATTTPKEKSDIDTIRTFMNKPNQELTFVGTDLPVSYFRVGKITKMGTGENMEAVEGWTRQVNLYDQKELLDGTCSVYQYHTDPRNNTLTAVIIRGLKPSEIDALKANGTICNSTNSSQKISKSEAETIAMDYLKRVLPDYEQIKDQLTYSLQNNGESYEWLWEDKRYKLPEGLSSRPYSYPVIRISVYGNEQIQYWNTIPLFKTTEI